MDTLLRAKHWQIFLFAFAIPWMLMLVIMGFGMADFASMIKANPDPEDMAVVVSDFMSSMAIGVLPITILSYSVVCAWLYAVSRRIGEMPPKRYQPLKPWTNTAIIVIGILYLLNGLLSYYLFDNMFEGIFDLENQQNPANPFEMFGSKFMLFNLASMVLSFVTFGLAIFVYYQLAFAIKGAETQQYLRSSEIIGPFFSLLFLFVGIWFLQPIINKLHEEGPGGGDSLDRTLVFD